MSWQLTSFALLALVLAGGLAWYERSRPSAKVVAIVASLAALAVAGRVALAPIPNVVATTDIVLLSGYALGAAPGYAIGALAALVSNFWLGQGPWTPWQMAAWGMVGIGGAALARITARRLGRLGLAAACGIAGLAYGALLDLSTMVTYGGDQTLERYLALSARGLPFNVAHALGNVAFALVAGPALVRMLLRFRSRLEVQWRPLPATAAVLFAAVVGVGAAASAVAGPAAGVAASGKGKDAAVRWLARAQNRDGGFPATPGGESGVEMTGWAMLGLEGAGRNPRDVRTTGRSPVDYLRSRAGKIRSTGDLERTILALEAAGLDSSSFAGRNLVAELRRRRRADGSFERQVGLTSFAVLALRAAGNSRAAVAASAGWIAAAANPDGGWGSLRDAPSESDSTGAALQALETAGAGGEAVRRGVTYLRRTQRRGGGWSLARGGPVNSQSTAWSVQGLLAAGADPASLRRGGRNPFDYLAARQAGDGHYAYSATGDQSPVWVTAQALLAVSRAPFPLDPVPRAPRASTAAKGSAGAGTASKQSSGTSAGASRAKRANGKKNSKRSRSRDQAGAGSSAADKGAGDSRAAGRAEAPAGAGALSTREDRQADETDTTPYLIAALAMGLVAAGALWRRRRAV